MLGSQGMHAEAIELYDRAIGLWRSEPRPPARDLAEALNDRGMIDYRIGRLDAALAAMNEGVAVLRAGGEEASANGVMVGSKGASSQVRVTTATGVAIYKIDRWD